VKVVLDTNVLVAAFASEKGFCRGLYRLCVRDHRVFASQHILDELRRNLPAKVKLTASHTDEIVGNVRDSVTMTEPMAVDPSACRDPDDLPVLGTAVAAGADCIVTGDADLLELEKYEGIAILSPRAFYERLR
jgi:uncharacterized protein